jgi:hypothetical protein
MSQKFGPEAWPVFKKLIELDFELGKPTNRQVRMDKDEIAERTGYEVAVIEKIMKKLVSADYVTLKSVGGHDFFIITTPIRTPKLILDIPFEKGGVKGAPNAALTNSCLRRFLESGEEN